MMIETGTFSVLLYALHFGRYNISDPYLGYGSGVDEGNPLAICLQTETKLSFASNLNGIFSFVNFDLLYRCITSAPFRWVKGTPDMLFKGFCAFSMLPLKHY